MVDILNHAHDIKLFHATCTVSNCKYCVHDGDAALICMLPCKLREAEDAMRITWLYPTSGTFPRSSSDAFMHVSLLAALLTPRTCIVKGVETVSTSFGPASQLICLLINVWLKGEA